MDIGIKRDEYAQLLKELTEEEQCTEIKQFLCDMMDWTEQSDAECLYIKLYDILTH